MLTRTVRQCSWGVMCLWSRLWLIAPKLWMCIGRPSCTRPGVWSILRHHTREKTERGKVSPCRSAGLECVSVSCVGYRRRVVRDDVAYLVEAHRPALKDLIPPGELRKQKRETNEGSGRCLNTLEGRGWGRGGKGREGKEGAHCAHRKGLCAGRAPRCRHPPPCVAIECNRGPSASPETHCIRGLSRNACVRRAEKARARVKTKGQGSDER